ncbi:JAB domain-containing protein [Archangium minus]|uniref:JAB domain-containing protein n=2 Tax=Archangium minus TaxID=83450 RepID=A0ABY9XAR3_9BACT|nr:JAB domain-containing protein [Archangium minus]
MPDFGPFQTYSDALLSACSRLLSLPNAVTVSPNNPNFKLYWVFVVHNHPVGDALSRRDIRFIVEQGQIHGFSVKTREREIPIGIVAFFSEGGVGHASCDGFFQYVPLTGELLKWTVEAKEWRREQYGTVRWLDSENFEIELR